VQWSFLLSVFYSQYLVMDLASAGETKSTTKTPSSTASPGKKPTASKTAAGKVPSAPTAVGKGSSPSEKGPSTHTGMGKELSQ
jgi:hypothetical protein